jgi:hypothetical protein
MALIDFRQSYQGLVAHEIAHVPYNAVFTDDHLELGLMGEGEVLGEFTPATIHRLRRTKKWDVE